MSDPSCSSSWRGHPLNRPADEELRLPPLPPRADRDPRSHVRVTRRPYDHEREP